MLSLRSLGLGLNIILQFTAQAAAGNYPTAPASANPTLTYPADHVIGYAVESGNSTCDRLHLFVRRGCGRATWLDTTALSLIFGLTMLHLQLIRRYVSLIAPLPPCPTR